MSDFKEWLKSSTESMYSNYWRLDDQVVKEYQRHYQMGAEACREFWQEERISQLEQALRDAYDRMWHMKVEIGINNYWKDRPDIMESIILSQRENVNAELEKIAKVLKEKE